VGAVAPQNPCMRRSARTTGSTRAVQPAAQRAKRLSRARKTPHGQVYGPEQMPSKAD